MTSTRPLRVAILITRLEGGAGVLALRGARVLDPEKFEVTFITGSGNHLIDQATAAGLDVFIEPALRTPIDPRSDFQALHALGSLLSRGRFDIVHTHTAKAGVLGRMAASRAAVQRIVHTYHGFPFHEFQSFGRRSAYVAIERRMGRITDMALCVGSGVAAEAVRRGLIAPDRVRTIGVAVDTGPEVSAPARSPAAREKARHALGLPENATVVGVVGRLTYQKAPEDFLAAMRLLGRPDVIGIWIGGGELKQRIRRMAALQPGARVLLAGERLDVPDILPALDVFVLPSRYEGLPTAVVEAMACGVPVVATAVNAVTDVVIPGETGLLVPPQRPDLLANAVRYLLDHPAAAARMATSARARLGARFGEQALLEVLSAAYVEPPLSALRCLISNFRPSRHGGGSTPARVPSKIIKAPPAGRCFPAIPAWPAHWISAARLGSLWAETAVGPRRPLTRATARSRRWPPLMRSMPGKSWIPAVTRPSRSR